MKKLLFGLIATVMFSVAGNANTISPVNPFQKSINMDKKYVIKLMVSLGGFGSWGVDFVVDWPIAPTNDGLYETTTAKLSKDGSTLTVTFKQEFPVNVLSIANTVEGVKKSKEGSLNKLSVLAGDYKILKDNVVVFNVQAK